MKIIPDRKILRAYSYGYVRTQMLCTVSGEFLHNGLLYMRINVPFGVIPRITVVHAMCLHTGDIHQFCSTIRVTPVEVECVINPRRWWEFWK